MEITRFIVFIRYVSVEKSTGQMAGYVFDTEEDRTSFINSLPENTEYATAEEKLKTKTKT